MKNKAFTLMLLIAAATGAHRAAAQTNGGTGKGLDALDEQMVMRDLARNKMMTVLDHDFKEFKIPPEQQAAVSVLYQLQDLANPAGKTVAESRALMARVAKGLATLLPKETDPDMILDQVNTLYVNGIFPQQTTLEYFGENPVAQADLKPSVETAKKMFLQGAVLAKTKKETLANAIKTNADYLKARPIMDKLSLDTVIGEYSNMMANYALCISLPTGDANRKKFADEAIEFLKQYDNPNSGLQSSIHLAIGKLHLAGGDFANAKKTLDEVVAGTGIQPPPPLADQNTARYFGIVAQISQGNLAAAQAAIPNLEQWETSNYIPTLKNPADVAFVKAGLSMLNFREYSAEADAAKDDESKKAANAKAIAVLAELVKSQPDLKDLVYDQLLGRIPQNPDYTTLNPLILQAMQEQAYPEMRKPDNESVDESKVNRSIGAAREIIKRKGQPGIDDKQVSLSMFFIFKALDRLHKKRECAAACMDYAEQYPGEKVKAQGAIDRAGELVFQLRKEDITNQENRKLYNRFLPLAINPPYEMKTLAFSYAASLQGESKWKDAVHYYDLVPKTDKRFGQSEYLKLLCLNEMLSDKTLQGADREAIVSQIFDLQKDIDGINTAANGAEKKTTVDWVVQSDLIAARLARVEMKKPEKSLEILTGFEDRIAESKDPLQGHTDALVERIQDNMASGKMHDATQIITDLMTANPAKGQALLFTVLQGVEHQATLAKAAGNKETIAKLAQDKAELTGFFVKFAESSKDPNTRAQIPALRGFDADSKRKAGELLADAAAKKKQIEAARAEFQDLLKAGPNDLAQLGVGSCEYDLGNYQLAIDALSPLVNGKKVGNPMVQVGGQLVENSDYWEINYQLVKSLVEVYKTNPKDPTKKENLEHARQYLGVLFLNNGTNTGGQSFHDDYVSLQAEIAKLQK